jgi:uncharacterized membrane protein YjjP (DUF1212 family)
MEAIIQQYTKGKISFQEAVRQLREINNQQAEYFYHTNIE